MLFIVSLPFFTVPPDEFRAQMSAPTASLECRPLLGSSISKMICARLGSKNQQNGWILIPLKPPLLAYWIMKISSIHEGEFFHPQTHHQLQPEVSRSHWTPQPWCRSWGRRSLLGFLTLSPGNKMAPPTSDEVQVKKMASPTSQQEKHHFSYIIKSRSLFASIIIQFIACVCRHDFICRILNCHYQLWWLPVVSPLLDAISIEEQVRPWRSRLISGLVGKQDILMVFRWSGTIVFWSIWYHGNMVPWLLCDYVTMVIRLPLNPKHDSSLVPYLRCQI